MQMSFVAVFLMHVLSKPGAEIHGLSYSAGNSMRFQQEPTHSMPWQGTLASNVDSLVAEILGGAVCTVYLHAVLVDKTFAVDTHQNPGNNVAKWFGSRAFGGK